jgi:hypothetical protein
VNILDARNTIFIFSIGFIFSPSPQPNTTYSGLSRRVEHNEYVSTLERKAFVYFFFIFNIYVFDRCCKVLYSSVHIVLSFLYYVHGTSLVPHRTYLDGAIVTFT